MNEWMNEWINEWMNEWMNEWINEWINKQDIVKVKSKDNKIKTQMHLA